MLKTQVKKWLEENKIEGKIEHPANERFGDFAVRSGRKIEIGNEDLIEKIENVSGFTNIFLSQKSLIKEAEKIINGKLLEELMMEGKGKKMVIDYSSPNIAKAFGIGHLRSTNIGQAIYNIYQILGWECIGENHLGDWGTQFGKLIVSIKKWGPSTMSEIKKLKIEDLEALYVRFHKEAENNEELINEGRKWFSKLENGDKEARDIWQKCVEISLNEFNKVYGMLGVKIDYSHGESFYEDKMEEIIKILKEKNLIKNSQGAKIIEFKNMPPAMVEKSNGTSTYFTRDLAAIKYRIDTWNPDLIIYEIGADQNLHMRQLFETTKMLGYSTKFVHISHGLIRWKEGKFSTRKGETIHLSEVISKAMQEAKKLAPNNSSEQIKAVAIGAIKFNDLAQDPKKDIIFDWERVMSMEGNSGPYLQYTYARCMSVIANKKPSFASLQTGKQEKNNWNKDEMALLRYFYQFEEKIIEAAERFSPAIIAEYLLILSRKYNEFYAKNRIIGESEEKQRLFLTITTANILKKGLFLLGIETLEKM